ncbi:MAG: S8 family serine peptidase [Alphaproteobacteria bacterium]|nr:S8 family serine peptidase [Alphaproteobacteria bacterium]
MSPKQRRSALVLSVCVFAVALGGCGGGGTGVPSPDPIVSVPTPSPPPPPPPAPPPPPPPPPSSSYDDAEYRRSAGSVHGAITAYESGSTGQGVKIAVIDTGLNPGLHEFTGRVDPASQDVVASRGVSDSDGHGTAVAATAVANRDGGRMEGVAFGAMVLSLDTENPNDCKGSDGCTHSSTDIAKAIDIARQNGAKVINISLGGTDPSNSVNQALARAAAAGIVVVMSAGNSGDKPEGANPEGFALSASAAGNVIIAGSVGVPVNGDPAFGIDYKQLSTFSNRAGSGAANYLAAVGYRVLAPDNSGTYFLWSGTSFSAPVISGAAALLASAFPNLTGAQIIDILYRSADDGGAAGTDAIFGRGILNISRAFAPLGTLALPDGKTPVATITGSTSTPMGDASPRVAGMVALDSYGRAYALDYQQMLRRAPQEQPLAMGLQIGLDTATAARGRTAVSITVDRNMFGQPAVGLAQLGLTYEDARKARVLSGLAISRLTKRTTLALGLSESGRTLQQRLAGAEGAAFLVARDPMTRTGFYGDSAASIGVRQQLGRFGLTATAERGRVWQPGLNRALLEPAYTVGSLGLDRGIGPLRVTVGGTRLTEQRTVLGAGFSDALGGGGATSWFADAGAALRLGGGWSATAGYRRGWTSLAGAAGLARAGRLVTDAWSFDIAKSGVFRPGDRFALRLMQPLRVASGGFTLSVPVSYDYGTLQAGYGDRFFNLAPTGREIDLEAAYGVPLLGGQLTANAFARRQPGNIAALAPDLGGALRFSRGF